MIQLFDDKKNVQNFEKRLSNLRTQMKLKGLDGYLVPRADFFQGEYVAPNDERLAFLTGFSGLQLASYGASRHGPNMSI